MAHYVPAETRWPRSAFRFPTLRARSTKRSLSRDSPQPGDSQSFGLTDPTYAITGTAATSRLFGNLLRDQKQSRHAWHCHGPLRLANYLLPLNTMIHASTMVWLTTNDSPFRSVCRAVRLARLGSSSHSFVPRIRGTFSVRAEYFQQVQSLRPSCAELDSCESRVG
jgi:hypothetical protein